MSPERIAELRVASHPDTRNGGYLREALDEIERLQAEAVDVEAWSEQFAGDAADLERLQAVCREVAAEMTAARRGYPTELWSKLYGWRGRLEAALVAPAVCDTLAGDKEVAGSAAQQRPLASSRGSRLGPQGSDAGSNPVAPCHPPNTSLEPDTRARVDALIKSLPEVEGSAFVSSQAPAPENCRATWKGIDGNQLFQCAKTANHSTCHESVMGNQIWWDDASGATPHQPAPGKCNAPWRYPDDGCMQEHRGEIYLCAAAAGHKGQHIDPGRATWIDAIQGAKPHQHASTPKLCSKHLNDPATCPECAELRARYPDEQAPAPEKCDCAFLCQMCTHQPERIEHPDNVLVDGLLAGARTKEWSKIEVPTNCTCAGTAAESAKCPAHVYGERTKQPNGVERWRYDAAVGASEDLRREVAQLTKERDEARADFNKSHAAYWAAESTVTKQRALIESLTREADLYRQLASRQGIANRVEEAQDAALRQIGQLRDALEETVRHWQMRRTMCRCSDVLKCNWCSDISRRVSHLLEVNGCRDV